jgi:multisubunit Na+/H+ antiporter MnhG subunit
MDEPPSVMSLGLAAVMEKFWIVAPSALRAIVRATLSAGPLSCVRAVVDHVQPLVQSKPP